MTKIELSKEQLEELNFWHNSGLEAGSYKSAEYYHHLIYGWSLSHYPDENDKIAMLKRAAKANDYALMQQIFFTFNKQRLSCYLSGGYDHCSLVHQITPYLCCAEYGEVFRAFPENLPLSANGYSMLVHATALLQCILYKGKYDDEKVIAKAEKYVASKQPIWNRAFVACFLAIFKEDAEQLSENLQVLCTYHTRQEISDYLKLHCQHAYGMIMIAKHNLPEEVFKKITFPEYKTFDSGYMQWLLEENYVRQCVYDYKEPFEEFNIVYDMPLPETRIHQPYLNSDNTYISAQTKKAYFLDVDAMNAQVVDYLIQQIKI